MNFFNNSIFRRWIGYFFAFIIVISVIFISNNMVENLKVEEKNKLQLYANSIEILAQNDSLSSDVQLFLLELGKKNTSIPVIILDKNDEILGFKNIDSIKISDSIKSKFIIKEMKSYYEPIAVDLPSEKLNIYYKNSYLLTQLRYYPLILIVILALFAWFTVWYFKTLKKTEQSLLWVGLAKETAHQIGTPLSSLMGWLEFLKIENSNAEFLEEMEKDIDRLKIITDRFSKIGSKANLENANIISIISETYIYLKTRISTNIDFEFTTTSENINVNYNKSLISWVIENLVKNAVDAIKSKGKIILNVSEDKDYVYIDISDTGHGMSKKQKKEIFKPGFTTKKRGWGLGLSLVKRIVEENHNGKVFVLKSSENKGTTFRVVLQKA